MSANVLALYFVAPAQAGAQFLRCTWIPAFAGMTADCCYVVAPAQAGAQFLFRCTWIPAFVGMTADSHRDPS